MMVDYFIAWFSGISVTLISLRYYVLLLVICTYTIFSMLGIINRINIVLFLRMLFCNNALRGHFVNIKQYFVHCLKN